MRTKPSAWKLGTNRRRGSPVPHVGETKQPAKSRVARWRRWLVAAVVLLLLVWSAPMLVAHTPLRNQVLAWAAGDLNGTLTAESASLGWFSPVVLKGVEVRDPAGELVLSAAEISSDRTLLGLLGDDGDLGRLRLHSVSSTLRMRADGSNLEDVLFHDGRETETGQTTRPRFSELEIVDGALNLVDEHTASSQSVTSVQARFLLLDGGGQRLEGTAKFADVLDGGDLELTWESRDGGAEPVLTHFSSRGRRLPLAALQPLLVRLGIPSQLEGWLDGELNASWQSRGGVTTHVALNGDLRGERLLVASPRLSEPAIRMNALHLPIRMEWSDGTLHVERCVLDCDAGRMEVAGGVPLTMGAKGLGEQVAAALTEGAYRIEGRLDLPRLAAMFPETIRVRQETQLTDGVVNLRLERQVAAEGALWNGRLYATSVEALCGGRRVAWERPIELDAVVRATSRGPVIDRLVCQSEFLHLDGLTEIEADGAQTALIAADYDLNRLAQHLDRFLDLGPLEISGRGWTHLQWTQHQDGQFRAEARTQLQDYELDAPGKRRWREPSLSASASLQGKAEGARPYFLSAAHVDVQAGDDVLAVKLRKPAPFLTEVWPLEFDLRGEIAAWQARLTPFAVLWNSEALDAATLARISGSGQLEAQFDWSGDGLVVHHGSAAINDFAYRTDRLHVEEPRLQADFAGWWNRQTATLHLQSVQLDTAALTLETSGATILFADFGPPAARGDVAFSADLPKLQGWWRTNSRRSPCVTGQAAGRLSFSGEAGAETINFDAMLSNLAVRSTADVQTWTEPELRLVARAQRTNQAHTLIVDVIDVNSPSLRGRARGRIDDLPDAAILRLEGEVDYDANDLLALLLPEQHEQTVLSSTRRPKEFWLEATLDNGYLVADESPAAHDEDRRADVRRSPGLKSAAASSEFDWNGAVAYGFRIGPGRTRVELREGLVRFSPLSVSVNEGKLAAEPWFDLRGDTATFHLAGGTRLSQVRITPEMANGALKYVAPLLEGATKAQGRFSLELSGCSLPMAAPEQGEVAGRMTVHAVDIGPGPTLQAVLKVVNVVRTASGQPALTWETAQLRRESVVQFRMVDGSVYHDGLELDFDDLTVRTRGRVGLDGSLNLAATIASPRLPGSRTGRPGEIIVPIRGQLGQPELDLKILPATLGGSLRAGTLPRLPGLERFWEKLNGSKKPRP